MEGAQRLTPCREATCELLEVRLTAIMAVVFSLPRRIFRFDDVGPGGGRLEFTQYVQEFGSIPQ